jgi:uncharacterized protein YcaQ
VLSTPELFERVRAELLARGPLGNRSLGGNRVGWNYRGRKDTSLALFDMWLSGELMIHHREGFERVYDFRENIAPEEFDYVADKKEAEEFFARKAVSFHGLLREAGLRRSLDYDLYRKYGREEASGLLQRWIESGLFERIQVEGLRETFLVLAEDVSTLNTIAKGKNPRGWIPRETTTLEEVTLLSPLDIVSARAGEEAI